MQRKNWQNRTEFFTQGRGVRQGYNLSPALFNIYINELATIPEKSSVPGVSLHNQEVKCLLFADDLVLLSPTEDGLQQSLDLLEHYCQTWALTVNPKKTKIMILQKKIQISGCSTEVLNWYKTCRVLHTLHLSRI